MKAIILKSFAEASGEKPFDWNAVLAKPWTSYSWTELTELRNKARHWTTCACGSQCAIIPRSPEITSGGVGMPLDEKLANLGTRFYSLICHGEWRDAKLTLKQIERRSLILIKKELAKLPSPKRK